VLPETGSPTGPPLWSVVSTKLPAAATPPDAGLPEHSFAGMTAWLMAKAGALTAPKISIEVTAVVSTFLTLFNGTSSHFSIYTLPLQIYIRPSTANSSIVSAESESQAA